MADSDDVQHDRDEELRKQNLRQTLWFATFALGVGLLAVFGYAFSSGQTTTVNVHIAATSTIVAGAFALLSFGGGFLFGIPKSLQADAASVATPTPGVPMRGRLVTNTNLEQISDWLTKILVGVGLTQLVNVGPALWTLASQFKRFFGGNVSEVFIVGMVLYFTAAGFLSGYFWTRLFLAGAFSLADRGLEVVTRDVAELRGELESARQVAETALEKSQPETAAAAAAAAQNSNPDAAVAALAKRYNEIRETMSKGSARTAEMTRVVTEMSEVASKAKFDIAQWLFSDNRGQRLAAYARLLKAPDRNYADTLVKSVIEREDKNFAQFWGIRAIGKHIAYLSEPSVSSLRTWLQRLKPSSDRYAELRRVLADIDAQRGARPSAPQ